MAVKFNPFTGQLQIDEKGASASYIDGEVATYNDLPLDGTAALNSAWLVREASGVWPVSRKQAGIYIRTATAGSSRDADYTYAGTMPDVFSDAVLTIYDEASTTRTGQFNLGSITAGQNRVLTWPDGNGTIARTEDFAAPPAIGATTRNSGAFTTLSANNGTLTASAPAGTFSQTWNNASAAFTGLLVDITNTASSADSRSFEIRIGGTTRLMMRGNTLHLGQFTNSGFYTPAPAWHGSTAGLMCATNLAVGSSLDTILERGGAGILEQRNLANSQTFRLYNTFTDASNYERGFMRWSSNVLQIGTEKAGTGSARALEFQTDGVTRLTIGTTGESTFASGGAVVIANNTSSTSATTGALRVTGGVGVGGAVQAGGVFRGYDLLLWNTASRITWEGRAITLSSPASGVIEQSSTTTAQAYRLFNNVSGANFERANFRWASNEFIIDAEAGGTGTLRGIKIGSATSSLLGFYGAVPVDRPATVADPTGGGTIDAEARTAINDLIDRLQELGLIA